MEKNTTITKIQVYSFRMNETYEINRFSEYKIDIDLETDSDGFNMVFENPDGAYTGYFSKFDLVEVFINDVGVLKGSIDYVRYVCNDTQSHIQIVGRDMMSIFVDNDALPGTFYNVKPSTYITNKCKEYDISLYDIDLSVPVQPKLIIGTNESEMSIMNNLIIEDHKRIWAIYDTVYMGDWNTNNDPVYYFTRGVPSNIQGIPIKSLDLTDDGTDIKSEIRIYGSMNDGAEKVVGISNNDYMVGRNIRKRRTIRSYNDDGVSKYASSALRKVRDGFQSGINLEIITKTSDYTILPNNTAHVIDKTTKTNSIFFINSVTYMKSNTSGSITIVKMILGDSTFDVLWKNQGNKDKGYITGTNNQSLSELLKSKK